MRTDRQHEHMHTPIENESANKNDAGAAVLAHNLEKCARDHHRQQMVRGKRCGAVRGHARERGAEHGRGFERSRSHFVS